MSFSSFLRTYFSAYLPILLWTGFIFVLSNQSTLPGPDLYSLDFIFKKTSHVFVYFVLFFLINRALLLIHTSNILKASLWAFILSFLYAMTDEFHQYFVPGRTSTFRDLLYDTLGISIAWLRLHRYV